MRNGVFVGVKTFSDDEIQMLAAVQEHALDYFETGNQLALQGLLDIMKKSEGTVRQAAGEILSLSGKPQTATFLVGELARAQVQEEAAEVLTTIGQGALPDLIRACDSPEPSVRANALGSLGRIGDETALPAIVDKLADADPQVRAAAAQALGKMNAMKVIALLTQALTESDPETQELIISVIPDIGTSLVPALKAMLERGDVPSRQAAAFILGKLKAGSAVAALGRATEDQDWTVAWFATQALAEIGNEDCVQYLTAVLDISLASPGMVDVHAAAVSGLGTVGGDKARTKLREVLARHYEPNDVRSTAAYYLGELQDRDAVPLLIEAMSKFYYLRSSCAEALRKVTGYDFGTRPELWKDWWNSAPQPPPLYGDMIYVVPPPPPEEQR
jgi:HEAT repeat protein